MLADCGGLRVGAGPADKTDLALLAALVLRAILRRQLCNVNMSGEL